MNTQELKLNAGLYVISNETLSKSDKLKIIEFIDSADEKQVMFLLLDGRMIDSELLDEDKVKEVFVESGAEKVLQEIDPVTVTTVGGHLVVTMAPGAQAAVAGVAGVYLAYKLIKTSFRIYKDRLSKIGKQCKGFKHGSKERKMCESAARVRAIDAQISALKGASTKCKMTKHPAKCAAKIKQKIGNLNAKKQGLKV